jgi:iron complex transport system ATP-binding protein
MDSVVAQDLMVAYDHHVVVNDLTLHIPEKKITTIIGPNGCGKSTLLKAIGRILRPKGGFVYLNGEDIFALPTKEVAKRMAILPQSPHAPNGLTVGELVAYGRYPHQSGMASIRNEDREVIAWALTATRLAEFETTVVDTLSGGQKQRVWIAMALAQQTDLILLDEPTTYLDLTYQLEIMELLAHLNQTQERTIAMVLHDLNMAARFADYMITLRDGRIVCYGSPEEVITRDVLREAFQIDAMVGRDPHTDRPVCVTYNLLQNARE